MNTVLELLLRPLVKFCLAHSLKIQDVADALKTAFIETARREMIRQKVEISASRLSAMTGIPRREVGRVLSREPGSGTSENFIQRVIGQWRHDPRFSSSGGRPRVLEVEGKKSEFSELVKSVSRDMNPYTILFELERLGYVERTKRGLKLLAKLYIPQGDIEASFKLLSADLEDLISAVDENVFLKPALANLHLKTQFDNVVVESIPEIRRWMVKEGSKFQEKVRSFLSRFDKDLNSNLAGKPGGARVVLGAFSYVDTSAIAKKDRG